jgi:hypothetical protein
MHPLQQGAHHRFQMHLHSPQPAALATETGDGMCTWKILHVSPVLQCLTQQESLTFAQNKRILGCIPKSSM